MMLLIIIAIIVIKGGGKGPVPTALRMNILCRLPVPEGPGGMGKVQSNTTHTAPELMTDIVTPLKWQEWD
jgi:hypothetical protein